MDIQIHGLLILLMFLMSMQELTIMALQRKIG